MLKTYLKEQINISKEEYTRLKNLQAHFEVFWKYIKHLKNIDGARADIRSGKTISQDELFKELGV